MKHLYSKILCLTLALAGAVQLSAQEKLVVLNEGMWQSDNGQLSYFENGKIVSNSWFRDVNGYKIGDTPSCILQVKPNLIAIVVSNLLQFIDDTGKSVGAIEGVPNCRKLASDGEYLYVTSYAHECQTELGKKEFTKGFVAKIDVTSLKIMDAVEVGYEPEGIAYYKGKLFVANSGGYAYQENHDYEKTVNMIDAATMKIEHTVDTGQINLYGKIAQSGRYLCINSPGDYYTVDGATIVMDCEAVIAGEPNSSCFVKIPYCSTYSTTDTDGNFCVLGSVFSYVTYGYTLNCMTINPEALLKSAGKEGMEEKLPGTIFEDFKKMANPYGLYVNPYTGYIYGTDAGEYLETGVLYQWDPKGNLLGKYDVYINPGHFLALNPNGDMGVGNLSDDSADDLNAPIYDMQGIRVTNPVAGRIYIHNGKKVIF